MYDLLGAIPRTSVISLTVRASLKMRSDAVAHFSDSASCCLVMLCYCGANAPLPPPAGVVNWYPAGGSAFRR